MYSAVVVLEVLQKSPEPWRWGARGQSSEVDNDHLRGSSELKKLDKWVLHELCVCLVVQSCLTLCDPMDCSPARLLCPWDSPGKNTGVGCHALQPRDRTQVSCIAGWFFIVWATREDPHELAANQKNIVLKCHLLLFCATTSNHFLIAFWLAMKSGFYTTN